MNTAEQLWREKKALTETLCEQTAKLVVLASAEETDEDAIDQLLAQRKTTMDKVDRVDESLNALPQDSVTPACAQLREQTRLLLAELVRQDSIAAQKIEAAANELSAKIRAVRAGQKSMDAYGGGFAGDSAELDVRR